MAVQLQQHRLQQLWAPILEKKVNLALKETLQLYMTIMGSNDDVLHLRLSKNNYMSFCKFWTFLCIRQTREIWSLARKRNGLKKWKYKSWQGICKDVEMRVQTSVFPEGKILNSCTLPLQWPLPQQSSFFQNDLTLVVWSPSVELKWENKMALDLLTHLLKWNGDEESRPCHVLCWADATGSAGALRSGQYLPGNS